MWKSALRNQTQIRHFANWETAAIIASGHAIIDKIGMDYDILQLWEKKKKSKLIQTPQHLYKSNRNKNIWNIYNSIIS